MTIRHLLSVLTLSLTALGTSALASHPLDMDNYRCGDFSRVQVAFADGRVLVVMDGQLLTLPYLAELPGDRHVYASDAFTMVLDDDSIFIGPRLQQGNAIVRPTRECIWES